MSALLALLTVVTGILTLIYATIGLATVERRFNRDMLDALPFVLAIPFGFALACVVSLIWDIAA